MIQTNKAIYILTLFVTSCANPLNPFGNSLFDLETLDEATIHTDKSKDIKIAFHPERQNLHSSHNLKIKISSKKEISPDNVIIVWNKKIVGSGIRKIASTSKENNSIIIKIPTVKLSPDLEHDLIVHYRDNEKIISKAYDKPKCDIGELQAIKSLYPFKVSRIFKHKIEKYALEKKINPSLVSGLIASESSFNPNAVSYAKALGLTQITNIAHAELQDDIPGWNIDKRTRIFPAPVIKSLINLKKITKKSDWRLDIDKSIQGGVGYLEYLIGYWKKFEKTNSLTDEQRTNLILASYNFGPFRIKKYFRRNQNNWLNHKRLKEAKKYTNKIKSYCYHFTNYQGKNYDEKANHF